MWNVESHPSPSWDRKLYMTRLVAAKTPYPSAMPEAKFFQVRPSDDEKRNMKTRPKGKKTVQRTKESQRLLSQHALM